VKLLLALILIGGASAHRLDEYLQATLIGPARNGTDVEIQLTPGVAMLPALIAIIDRQGGEQAYAARVAREVELRIDGVPAPLSLVESNFPTMDSMREGLGSIRIKLHTSRSGHRLRFENSHLPELSVYLVNCLAAPTLVVTGQRRDVAQRSLEFTYSYSSTPLWPAIIIGVLLVGRWGIRFRLPISGLTSKSYPNKESYRSHPR
jgi:hypothetical protein